MKRKAMASCRSAVPIGPISNRKSLCRPTTQVFMPTHAVFSRCGGDCWNTWPMCEQGGGAVLCRLVTNSSRPLQPLSRCPRTPRYRTDGCVGISRHLQQPADQQAVPVNRLMLERPWPGPGRQCHHLPDTERHNWHREAFAAALETYRLACAPCAHVCRVDLEAVAWATIGNLPGLGWHWLSEPKWSGQSRKAAD